MSSILQNICKVENCKNKKGHGIYCHSHFRALYIYKDINHPIESRERHNMYKTTEYGIWKSMKSRCNSKNNSEYDNYGGRGIKVCPEWSSSFMSFYRDMGERPDGMTLDRIDNNKGYSKDNCRWATRTQQVINRNITKANKSGYTGVSYTKSTRKWYGSIMFNYKSISIGMFDTKEEAAWMRDQYGISLFGEDFKTNFEYK